MEGELEEYKLALSFLEKSDAELKIVIAGNHDTTLQKGYDGPWGPGDTRLERDNLHEDAVEMWTGEDAKKAGIVYLDEEVRSFELKNGARFTVSTERSSWHACTRCCYAFLSPCTIFMEQADSSRSMLPRISQHFATGPLPTLEKQIDGTLPRTMLHGKRLGQSLTQALTF